MIKQTWQQYFQLLHDTTVEAGQPLPFEAISDGMRSLGSRLKVSETIFPVHTLLPILLRYSHDHQRNVAPAHWVVDIFLSLSILYERLFDVLEAMFYAQEPPFIASA
ncbi:hypothetical protein LPUS_09355, partial [Lasallia pustulata]